MPRFPVSFNRRKSNADSLDNAPVAAPSFRVLDRSELASGSRNSDGSLNQRLAIKQSQSMPNHLSAADADEDNIFANLNVNRGSGSSNTTQTNSTDNSSRHSNVSTAPSSADLSAQQQQQSQSQHEDSRLQSKKRYGDVPVPPIPKSSTTSSFLKSAGRTFSFGNQRKPLPVSPLSDETPPHTPVDADAGRDRAMTASTITTATPPKLEEEFSLDLGGDFSKMLGNFDKRNSVVTVRDDGLGRPALAPRSLTGNRLNQPVPPQPEDSTAKGEASPYLWGNQPSTDRLLYSSSPLASTNENAPPVPRHAATFGNRPQTALDATRPTPGSETRPSLHNAAGSGSGSGLKRTTAVFGRRRSTIDYAAEVEDEDASLLLKESLFTVNRFLAGETASSTKSSSSPASRPRLTDDKSSLGYKHIPAESNSPVYAASSTNQDDDLFTSSRSIAQSTRIAQRFMATKSASLSQNKVMTPAQFERYRKDKEREGIRTVTDGTNKSEASDHDEEDNYDDDEDEAEKARQAAKQRRKQEAHMTVYRQQMMKVTGEAASGTPARGSLAFSMSSPNLTTFGATPQAASEPDEDEEVPLAILAAHGFPNKNRPPTRLSSMMSNPNLRTAAAPSYHRPQSNMGDPSGSAAGVAPGAGTGAGVGAGGRLPPFARNLPQDPYGLVNTNTREAFNLSGGAPAAAMPVNSGHVPPGGLVGVIANEERSRAMRRGSPALDATNKPMPSMGPMGQLDPMGGIPPHMMYPGMGQPQQMLTPGDQAQIQMSQQMQQFMQMQMQFMQMMTANNGAMPAGAMPMPMGMGMGMANPDMTRNSFAENASTMDGPYGRPDMNLRTMSMVQPSSSSWIQPLGQPSFAPSIRVQGVNGYSASIAPSERSNVGLPGRYRPVSQMPAGPQQGNLRKSTATPEALGTASRDANRNSNASSASPSEGNNANSRGPSPTGWDFARKHKSQSPLGSAATKPAADDDDDDEDGWAAMKAKRDKKRSIWQSKKALPSEIGAMIS